MMPRLRPSLLAAVPSLLAAVAALPSPAQPQDRSETRRIRLEADTLVDGIHCAPTGRAYAEFFVPSGRLAECPVATDVELQGHHLPAGSWVILHEDGRLRLAWLERDTRIGPLVCKGSGYKEWVTTFHDEGSLRSCYLPEDETIQEMPCRSGTFWGEITGGVTVAFHDNGRLASCGLSRSVTVDGIRYRRWQRIRLDPQGRPVPEH